MKTLNIRSTADLARMMGLSRWTVSRALNGHGDISQETAARVKAEAGRLGFSPSLLGRSLRSGRTDLVGVCVPDLEAYFLTNKILLMQNQLLKSGLHALFQIAGSVEEEISAIEKFAAMRCAGLITVASRVMDKQSSDHIVRRPVVHVDPLHARSGASVLTDRAHAMRLAVRHLHAQGCRHLLLAGIDPGGAGYMQARVQGILGESRRLRWDSAPVFLENTEENDFDAGTRAGEEILSRMTRKRTGVISLNDRVAFAAMQALIAAGVNIPADVAIVGYDHSGLAKVASPSITTIDPHPDKLIAASARLLLDGLSGSSSREKIVIKPHLVIGKST